MASLLRRVTSRDPDAERAMGWDEYVSTLGNYTQSYESTLATKSEKMSPVFKQLADGAFGANGVVFACMAVRQLVFSSVRFRYQRLRNGAPADMFGTPDLQLLETPWPGGTTQDLLSRIIQDADLSGNAFNVKDTPLSRLGGDNQAEIVRLRPDWISIAVGTRYRNGNKMGFRKLGYVYTEGGDVYKNDPVALTLDEVSHFMPIPDPRASFRGMSWLTPIVREIENDTLMNVHKRKFFENGATPNMVVKHAANADRDKIIAFNKRLTAESAGVENAYKTLNLYPGADATLVGGNMQQLDFKKVQGAGETRIAAAAGVAPIIVGLSEGLESATYSNYGQARRRFADGTMHPNWQNVAGSLAPLVKNLGADTRLWYDASDIPFLREDELDSAEIAAKKATTIRTLVDGGFVPDSVTKAVEADDFRLLEWSGYLSVQLQPPGTPMSPPASPPTQGGPA